MTVNGRLLVTVFIMRAIMIAPPNSLRSIPNSSRGLWRALNTRLRRCKLLAILHLCDHSGTCVFRGVEGLDHWHHGRRRRVAPDLSRGRDALPLHRRRSDRGLPALHAPGPKDEGATDRKSTRLNSSHLGISYA